MGNIFRPIDNSQLYLLPPSVQEWLPPNHLARFVVDVVGELDLTPILSAYSPSGRKAYHPEVLLGLLFYGYAKGVFSSRQLEQATYDTLDYRFVSRNEHPDHDTISAFHKRFLGELEGLFLQIMVLAKEVGFVRMGKVSLDGTKIQANASKHKALSWEYAERLEKQLKEEIAKLMEMAGNADAEETCELDLPAEIERREDRLKALREAKQAIRDRAAQRHEREQSERKAAGESRAEPPSRPKEERSEEPAKEPARLQSGDPLAHGKEERSEEPAEEPPPEPRAKDQVNLTDPESRIMKTSNGFEQCYNAQAVVDAESHLIVASHITESGNDKKQVKPALEALKKTEAELGKPEALLADAGYHSAANIDLCEKEGIVPYIAQRREKHHEPLEKRLEPPPECPGNASGVERARHRLKTPEGKAVYSKRKCTVETVFGNIKEALGFRRFHLRGKQYAQGEWTLVSLAWNLKRMHSLTSAA